MALVVETGAGVPQADTWVNLGDAEAHFAAYGGFWTGDNTAKEAALRRAALWLSTGFRWNGTKVFAGNMLAWPRKGASDCDGAAVAANVIPPQMIFAQLAAASFELQSPGGTTPVVDTAGRVKREKVGPIEVEYMTAQDQGISGAAAQRPMLSQINDLIRCLAQVGPRQQFDLIRG